MTLSDLYRETTIKALKRSGGNRRKAAELMGVSQRTVFRWIKLYNIGL